MIALQFLATVSSESSPTMKDVPKEKKTVQGARIIALAVLWLVPFLILTSALSSNWIIKWHRVGVPAMVPKFLDSYGLATAVETMHQGSDPLVRNPRDPYQRTTNYPRIWLYMFSAARITPARVTFVALIFCAMYLACISFLIAQSKHVLDAVIILVSSLSVAPLFALERGNNDLFVFSLVFLACVVANKRLKSCLFAAAGLLKFFPVAGMIVEAIRRPTRKRIEGLLLAGLVVLLILLQWHDLTLIRKSTQVSMWMSYGVVSLEEVLFHEEPKWGLLIGWGWVVILGCWIAAALAMVSAWKNPLELQAIASRPRFLEMFSVFGTIYVFTYAVGSNWDYRLVFLLPTLPFAIEMARTASEKRWAISYVMFVLLAENSIAFETSGGNFTGHIVTFTLFILMIVMLTSQAKAFLAGSNTSDLPGARSLVLTDSM